MMIKKFHSFKDVTDFLTSIIPSKKKATEHYNLDSMEALMTALGSPQEKYQVVHIAGTSGKTSTAYFVASLLQGTSKKVGLTVSPHVDSVAERVQINGSQLSEKEYCKEFTLFISTIDNLPVKPTYFELLLAFSFWEFAQKGVEYAVVEVGMGGLLDGTNVIQGSDKVCVITDIGLDHTEILGDTLTLIAQQKAGIARKGNDVFVYAQDSEVDDAISRTVIKNQAVLHVVQPRIEGYSGLPDFQKRNFHLALHVVNYIIIRDGLVSLNQEVVDKSMHTYIPARMEIIEYGKNILILDGSHNGQKMNTLVRSIQRKYPAISFTILIALSSGKDVEQVVTELKKIADRIIVTKFSGQQDLPKVAIDPNIIEQECYSHGIAVEIVEDPRAAFEMLQVSENPYKLVTGSFFLLNHVRPILKEQGLL